MLFNSYIFLIFLIAVLPIYYLLPKRYKNLFLVISSYFFYGYWDYRFCGLLAISTVIDFVIGLKLNTELNENKRKYLLWTSLAVNLGILGFFKYFDFFIGSFSSAFEIFGSNLDFLHLNIILPVGISFYTFQTMSYTIDIYHNRLKPTNNFIDFAVFVSFFPQLVAGPIERAKNLLPQISINPKPTKVQIQKGITLIILGLFKKVLIGDATGKFVDHIFSQPDIYKSSELLIALLLFALQIYADFSGYSNIARGTSKLLGFELMKNFEQPYLSQNITEFWRRWHISLSSWLKDYLYISLGGNRKGNTRTYINLMLTMLLGGLWHGASWNFVIWGGLHGIYLSIHKLYLNDRKIVTSYTYDGIVSFLVFLIKVLFTFILVLITWLFFRATDITTIIIFAQKMYNWEVSEFTYRFIKIASGFYFVSILLDVFEYYSGHHTFILLSNSKPFKIVFLTVLLLSTLLYMFQNEPMPFIYFQF